ncbi:hypothetical protein KKI24_16670 [bacterium]|nr:hypothetical protein [bacterium]
MGLFQKTIRLSTLLKLQLIYCILGIAYNVVSFLMVITIGRRLSGNAPFTGALLMIIYGLCLITGLIHLQKVYRFLMLLFVLVIGYSGFINHFIIYTRQPEVYASFLAWFSAVGINFFGLLLNLVAVSGGFEVSPSRLKK